MRKNSKAPVPFNSWGSRFWTLTYDLADHEDQADGWGDVEFLLGQQLVHAVLAR